MDYDSFTRQTQIRLLYRHSEMGFGGRSLIFSHEISGGNLGDFKPDQSRPHISQLLIRPTLKSADWLDGFSLTDLLFQWDRSQQYQHKRT